MTNKIDLDKLEELAKNATPGPWYDDSEWSPDDVSIFQGEPRDEALFIGNVGFQRFNEVGVAFDINTSNGLFIAAANPATVLALINRVRSAEEKLKAAAAKPGGTESRLEYKGYEGCYEWNDNTQIFHGEVLNSRDVITFASVVESEMLNEMKTSIDLHESYCAKNNRSPSGPERRRGPQRHR